MVLSFLAVLLVKAPIYGLVTLGIGLVQVVLILVSTGRMHDLAQRHLTTQAEAQAYLVEALAGVNLVKATGAEQRVIQRWSTLHHKALGVSLDKQQLSAFIQTLLDGLQTAAPLALLLLGAYQVLNGVLSLGEMLALNALAVGFLAPLDALVGSAQQFQTVGAHLNRLADVLGTPREEAGAVAPALTGQIELANVSYQYDRYSAPVLRDVSVVHRRGAKGGDCGPVRVGQKHAGAAAHGAGGPDRRRDSLRRRAPARSRPERAAAADGVGAARGVPV